MQEFFIRLWEMICEVFAYGDGAIALSQYSGWHFVILIFGTILALGVFAGAVFCAGWLLFHIMKAIFNVLAIIFSAKKRCSRIVCTSCGRTLDKCTCQKNKGRGYFRRLALYSKEKKAAQKAKKAAIKEKKKDK